MSKTVNFPLPVLGVDMLSDETSLIQGTARYAMNVDIDRRGNTKRRGGSTQRLVMSGLHSLFYAAQKGWTLVARDAQLYQLNPTSYALTSLATLQSTAPLSYTEYNGNIYYANKATLGWIPSNSTLARSVGVPIPNSPTLTPASGALLPGTYGVVVTAVDDRGEESGATPLQTIQLRSGGGVRLDYLTVNPGWMYFVYMTEPDGDQLRLAAEIPALFSTYVVGETATGGLCGTLGMKPMPPGDLVCWHSGRLFTAANGAVRFSLPSRPHMHDPAHGVIPMSGHIAFMESVGDGVYVGDSRGVWFLSGTDTVKFELRRVSSCRAVPRSSTMVPPEHFPEKMVPTDKPVALWLSTSGYVVGMPGGTTVELHPDRVKVPAGLAGRSVFLLRDGRKQIVTPVNSASTTTYGVAVDSTIP